MKGPGSPFPILLSAMFLLSSPSLLRAGDEEALPRTMAYQDNVDRTPPPQDAQPADPRQVTLVRAARNPLTDVISIPFQNNVNFGVGPGNDIQNVLNIQPIIPVNLGDWRLIARPIIPVIHQPEFVPGTGSTDGLGDVSLSLFLSPPGSSVFRWGVGPALLFPTATEKILGTQKYSAGPTAVAVAMEGPLIAGVLVNNLWSYSGTSRRADVNQLFLQPFALYTIADGWYAISIPVITANWEAPTDQRWTVPVGGGFGKVFRMGGVPFNLHIAAYENVVHPRLGASWTLQVQFQILLPK
jgi:hypothetical protein